MKKLLGSNFATAAGLVVLAVAALGAGYMQLNLLTGFLTALFIICAVAFLWARVSLSRVQVRFGQEDSCAFPGEELETRITLTNGKAVPLLWLTAALQTNGKTCVAPLGAEEENAEISQKLLWIMPHQKISWTQKALAKRRGVCRVEKIDLQSGDGFGLSVQRRGATPENSFRYVVYPAINEVDPTVILNNMTELDNAPSGFYTDVTLVKNTRDYRNGDSFKEINYRVMARTGEVQVNEYEKLAMCRVCFIADIESFTDIDWREHNGEKVKTLVVSDDELERMYSLMASLIISLHERGVSCSLIIPAYGENEARIVIPDERQMQVMQLLTALSETEYDCQKTSLPTEEVLSHSHRLGQLFMFSRSVGEPSCERLTSQIEELSVLHIVQKDNEGAAESARNIFKETEFWSV